MKYGLDHINFLHLSHIPWEIKTVPPQPIGLSTAVHRIENVKSYADVVRGHPNNTRNNPNTEEIIDLVTSGISESPEELCG